MAIRRRKKLREFTQVDNAAILNADMSLKAKGLLLVMMSRPADWDFYMPWLEQQSKDGKEAHQSAMKELEELGYVVREKIRGKRGRIGWDYIVDDEIHGKPAATIEGKTRHGQISTTTGFTTDGGTTDGKPATSNTEVTNTDLTNIEKREEAPSAPLSELPEDELIESPEHQIEQGTEIDPQKDSGKANEGKSNVKASGKVPGGAAAGAETTEAYLRRKFSHSFVNTMLEELQPLGVDRKRDWFSIPIERAQQLAEEARATHKQFKVQVQTRLKVLLDEEVQRKGLPELPATPAEDKFSKSAWEN